MVKLWRGSCSRRGCRSSWPSCASDSRPGAALSLQGSFYCLGETLSHGASFLRCTWGRNNRLPTKPCVHGKTAILWTVFQQTRIWLPPVRNPLCLWPPVLGLPSQGSSQPVFLCTVLARWGCLPLTWITCPTFTGCSAPAGFSRPPHEAAQPDGS